MGYSIETEEKRDTSILSMRGAMAIGEVIAKKKGKRVKGRKVGLKKKRRGKGNHQNRRRGIKKKNHTGGDQKIQGPGKTRIREKGGQREGLREQKRGAPFGEGEGHNHTKKKHPEKKDPPLTKKRERQKRRGFNTHGGTQKLPRRKSVCT